MNKNRILQRPSRSYTISRGRTGKVIPSTRLTRLYTPATPLVKCLQSRMVPEDRSFSTTDWAMFRKMSVLLQCRFQATHTLSPWNTNTTAWDAR